MISTLARLKLCFVILAHLPYAMHSVKLQSHSFIPYWKNIEGRKKHVEYQYIRVIAVHLYFKNILSSTEFSKLLNFNYLLVSLRPPPTKVWNRKKRYITFDIHAIYEDKEKNCVLTSNPRFSPVILRDHGLHLSYSCVIMDYIFSWQRNVTSFHWPTLSVIKYISYNIYHSHGI